MKYLLLCMPMVGMLLLTASYTSADLNDEVKVVANNLKATTMSLSVVNTIDNTHLPYLFSLSRFQNGSLSATTFRVINTGKTNTKYFLEVSQLVENIGCSIPKMKILFEDKIVFNDKISAIDLELPEIGPGEKNDFVVLLSMSGNTTEKLTCNYQMKMATKKNPKMMDGIFDLKKIEGKMDIE